MNNKINLNYRVSGKGHPVVFLHGFLESNSMWNYVSLEGIQSICIDLPGHGKSPLGTGEISMSSIADQVSELLSGLDIEHFDVVGHSMGGYVAMEVKKNDSRCDKLVLLNSNFWSDNEMKKVDRQRVADLVQTKKLEFVRMAIPNLFMNPKSFVADVSDLIEEASSIEANAIATSSIAMSVRNDNSDVAKEWGTDLLVIQGEFDSIVSSELMKEHLKNTSIQFVEIPSGHMAHIEHTKFVEDAILKFIG